MYSGSLLKLQALVFGGMVSPRKRPHPRSAVKKCRTWHLIIGL